MFVLLFAFYGLFAFIIFNAILLVKLIDWSIERHLKKQKSKGVQS